MSYSNRWVAAVSAVLLLCACQAAAPQPSEPLLGVWGGQHVRLDLTGAGGVLDYDCAAGSIDEPLQPNSAGVFTARGTHSPGQGGPARVSETPPRLPAEYSGRVRGDRMTLHVRVVSSNLNLGPFTLERGAEAMLMRCL